MKLKNLLLGAGIGLAGLIGVTSTSYVVDATEHVVITRMGKPVKVVINPGPYAKLDPNMQKKIEDWNSSLPEAERVEIEYEAGLYLFDKLPFVDTVNSIDSRVLEYDSSPRIVVTKDKKKLLVGNYARWRVENPVVFLQTLLSESAALPRFDDFVYSEVREQVGNQDLIEVVRSSNQPIRTEEEEKAVLGLNPMTNISGTATASASGSKSDSTENYQYRWAEIKYGRPELLKRVTEGSQKKASTYGLNVLDVRVKTADLPPENADSVYKRMSAERNRIATQYRSEGEEKYIKIRSGADKEKAEIESAALENAGKKRGAADQEVFRIYTEAQQQNPGFFELWRTKKAYETAFGGEKGTTLVLPANTSFNRYLK
ncbi:protease modulator HflC [Candidatus Woesearchaeota archaeon]|nr:protease modulator HflC [Candidatus Woesearchaeota archaeon]